jgi:predicted flap endonuclease-1-like 5' DNA nuclease
MASGEPVVAEATPADVDEEAGARPSAVVTVAEPATDVEPATIAEPVADAAEPEVPAEETSTPVVVPAPRAAVEDAVPAEASAGEEAADDFRQIQGIGPKMAGALQAAGIRTYQQLAELDEAALRETIKAAGLRAAPTLATWPQQAKLLADARTETEQVLAAGSGEDA